MMRKYIQLIGIILPVMLFYACQEQFELGEVPSEEAAAFTYAPSADNPNIIVFTAVESTSIKRWDFGNDVTGEGAEVTGTYPYAGTYTVTLTIYASGGSASTSQEIVIENTDLSLVNSELFDLLTGGADATEGKTWVIDSAHAAHFGVGPTASDGNGGEYVASWYNAGANEKAGGGMYDDRYTFFTDGFSFDMVTNGDVYINSNQGANFPGAYESEVGDMTAPFTPQDGLTWGIAESEDEPYPTLTITSDGFIGYFTGVRTYQILVLEENELYLRYLDASSADLAWYLRLIPAGYDPDEGGGGEEEETIALPLDFESLQPDWTVFGGSTFSYVDNPDASGINTSSTVLQTEHGGETWAGLYTALSEPLDLSSMTNISLKVWAPTTGTFRLKMENPDDSGDYLEVDQTVGEANTWVELTFDVSEAVDRSLSLLVLFPGWDVSSAGTFYVDDISQVGDPVELPLTFESSEPEWTVFGGSSYSYADNPDATGINTSSRVLETVHGGETWAGLYVALEGPLDLSTTTTVSLKVYAPTTGSFLLKLENPDDSGDYLEVQQTVDVANEWTELTFDISGAVDRSLSLFVIFPGWSVADAGTFYVDDIQLAD